jgi:hypothetical protein
LEAASHLRNDNPDGGGRVHDFDVCSISQARKPA